MPPCRNVFHKVRMSKYQCVIGKHVNKCTYQLFNHVYTHLLTISENWLSSCPSRNMFRANSSLQHICQRHVLRWQALSADRISGAYGDNQQQRPKKFYRSHIVLQLSRPSDHCLLSPCLLQQFTANQSWANGPVRHHSTFSETLAYYYSPEFPPIHCAMRFLELTHDLTGLPWWMSLALSVVLLRTTVTLPFTIAAHRNAGRLRKQETELREKADILRADIRAAKQLHGWDEKYARKQFHVTVSNT